MLKVVTISSPIIPASSVPSTKLVAIEQNIFQVSFISCVYCGEGHLYDNCLNNPASVNYVGNYNRGNNPYSNTYNLGWRQHLNFSWSNQAARSSNNPNRPIHPLGFTQQGQRVQTQPQAQPSSQEPSMSLESMLKAFISKTEAHIQNQGVALRNLENQVGQLASTLSSRPTSNTEMPKSNGKEHCKAI